MIVTGGENVYSTEVEDVLFRAPAVLEAAVFGVPDDRWGEAVHAVVVPRRRGAEEELHRRTAATRSPATRCPSGSSCAPSRCPKSGAGKVLKRELRAPYWAGPRDAGRRRVTTAVPDGRADLPRADRRPTRGRCACAELVYAAAERCPGRCPSRAAIDAERDAAAEGQAGAGDRPGHLRRARARPPARRAAPHARDVAAQGGGAGRARRVPPRREHRPRPRARRPRRANRPRDHPEPRVPELRGRRVGVAALETAVDLVLLDDGDRRRRAARRARDPPKYAGRRILGSGLNLTRLYHGKISLVEFMLERELGAVAKMYRGHDLGAFETVLETAARSRGSPRWRRSRSAARASCCW